MTDYSENAFLGIWATDYQKVRSPAQNDLVWIMRKRELSRGQQLDLRDSELSRGRFRKNTLKEGKLRDAKMRKSDVELKGLQLREAKLAVDE